MKNDIYKSVYTSYQSLKLSLLVIILALFVTTSSATDAYFIADKTVIRPDECVHISWYIPETTNLTISKWLNAGTSYLPREDVDTSGSFDYCDDSTIYSSERPFLSAKFELTDWEEPITYILNIYVLPLDSVYSPDAFAVQDSELSDPPSYPADSELGAIYQAFEHGFMLHLLPSSCVFSIYTGDYTQEDYEAGEGYYQPLLWPENAFSPRSGYAVCVYDESFPENPISEVPEGFVLPTGAIGSIWGNNTNIRHILGYAISEELPYLPAPIDPAPLTYSPYVSDIAVVSLPDGQVLYCGQRAASSGNCWVAMPQ